MAAVKFNGLTNLMVHHVYTVKLRTKMINGETKLNILVRDFDRWIGGLVGKLLYSHISR
jgi:hypothetical protein